ncbi:MAG: glutamine--fructose-6-phosphate transaminase (isomerizing) [Acidobacteriota bacterium]|nr:glutamine--fructose-6-phosphate transaminase (isomerizing) [Acidobacteriota bacterium]MDW3228578.1 glutamine--fructose-6-phosphate transaminase (isomerizing) [Acidobacteriota bacterium]
MCGIFGIIYQERRQDLGRILLEAGRRLTYRGYDSVGLGTFDGQKAELRKDVGKIDEVAKKLHFEDMSGYKGIVQLRWATFGQPRPQNAQPHFDCPQRLIGAHNGNIVNTKELIQSLTAAGHKFRGENDGEVCVHAVEEAYKTTPSLGKALEKADRMLQGDYAFCVTELGSDLMYCVKKYSSLYLGVGQDFICCSSDLPSILPLTRKIVSIKDGEYVEFSATSYRIKNLFNGQEIKREPYECTLDIEQAQKGEYPHYMLKEIYEQPEKARALLEYLGQKANLAGILNQLKKVNRVFLIGSGSSYNACTIGAFYLNAIARLEAIPVIAGAFGEYYQNLNPKKEAFILVSQSGETKDVINVLNILESQQAQNLIALVNVLGSSLQLRVKHHLPLMTNIEISVPATKTFLNQVIAFLVLACELAKLKGIKPAVTKKDFQQLPGLIQAILSESSGPVKELARILKDKKYLFYLGYGISYGACLEGALKLKEVSYIPCEAMYSSEFKHGPLAIISPDDWVMFISTSKDARMTISHMNEISCRYGKIALIGPNTEFFRMNSHFLIPLASDNYFFSPVLSTVVAQLLAYYVSQELGYDPDQPRNISKTLTVD